MLHFVNQYLLSCFSLTTDIEMSTEPHRGRWMYTCFDGKFRSISFHVVKIATHVVYTIAMTHVVRIATASFPGPTPPGRGLGMRLG